MAEKNKKQESLGYTLASLGGLLVILNLSTLKDSEWRLVVAFIAVILIMIGLYLINKAKGEKEEA